MTRIIANDEARMSTATAVKNDEGMTKSEWRMTK